MLSNSRLVEKLKTCNVKYLVCATSNPDKASEIADILDGVAVLLPRPAGLGEIEENATDLLGNATLKAYAVSRFANIAAVADDTGLEVDALDGAPGVYSARYAGDNASYKDNVMKLLHNMSRVPSNMRSARFRTVAVVCWPDGSKIAAEGSVEGHIAFEPQGVKGFGYDTVFIPAVHGSAKRNPCEMDSSCEVTTTHGMQRQCTFAEMDTNEKHHISHRGKAFRYLSRLLVEQWPSRKETGVG